MGSQSSGSNVGGTAMKPRGSMEQSRWGSLLPSPTRSSVWKPSSRVTSAENRSHPSESSRAMRSCSLCSGIAAQRAAASSSARRRKSRVTMPSATPSPNSAHSAGRRWLGM